MSFLSVGNDVLHRNPFVNRPGDDRIYTFGHRNPQGTAFRPGTGQPYSIEHGPDKNDEVKPARRRRERRMGPEYGGQLRPVAPR